MMIPSQLVDVAFYFFTLWNDLDISMNQDHCVKRVMVNGQGDDGIETHRSTHLSVDLLVGLE